MKTHKILIAILAFAAMAGCKQQQSSDEIRKEINSKKKEISELEKDIWQLEEKLEEDSAYKVPVNIKEIQPEKFVHMFDVNGSVESDLQATISAETNGQIKKFHVEEGQRVSQGQLLVSLNTEVTRKSIEEIKTSLELARTTYQKQKKLWKKNIGSEMQYLQAKNRVKSLESKLETMKAQLDMAIVKAPFSGIVDDIMMKKGDLAMPGKRILKMVNLNKLKVNASVSESYLSKIEEGDTVKLEFPAYPEIILKTPIHRIGNIIHPDNRTFEVQLKINNIEEKLKPNIVAVMHINDYTSKEAFVVPSIIIKKDMKGRFLFVSKKDAKKGLVAEKRYVETGKSYKDETEILSGLSKGEHVIVDGYNMVTTGTTIHIKEKI